MRSHQEEQTQGKPCDGGVLHTAGRWTREGYFEHARRRSYVGMRTRMRGIFTKDH